MVRLLKKRTTAAKSDDPKTRIKNLSQLRRTVAGRDPPISELIETGFLPTLVEYLEAEDSKIRYEAAWIISLILLGTDAHIKAIVNAGVIRPLIKLLSSDDLVNVEQAIWALEKIIGENKEFRDQCLQFGIVDPLLKFIEPETPLRVLKIIGWIFLRLCLHKIEPLTASTATFQKMLPALLYLIQHSDHEILQNALSTIAHITDRGPLNVRLILDAKFLPHLLKLLEHTEMKIVIPALHSIGNMATINEKQTKELLEHDILKLIAPLLRINETQINREAVWFISNVAASAPNHIHDIFDAKLMSSVNKLLVNSDPETQTEAAWVISNIVDGGEQDELVIIRLFEWDVIESMCVVLQMENDDLIYILLKVLDNMLEIVPYNKTDILLKLLKHNGEDKDFAQLSSIIVNKLFVGKNNKRLDDNNKWVQLKAEVRQKIEL
ncbi:IBB domain-containing protein [Aphelenchoides bicaudatus]|nr:IBB domain-containing protein [Aphelenchoides bicaudatus]